MNRRFSDPNQHTFGLFLPEKGSEGRREKHEEGHEDKPGEISHINEFERNKEGDMREQKREWKREKPPFHP